MSKIIPSFRYENAPAAIEWLCNALGFEKHMVVPGPENTIAHAQLNFGKSSMIMLGSATDNEYGKLVSTPEKLKGCTGGSTSSWRTWTPITTGPKRPGRPS